VAFGPARSADHLPINTAAAAPKHPDGQEQLLYNIATRDDRAGGHPVRVEITTEEDAARLGERLGSSCMSAILVPVFACDEHLPEELRSPPEGGSAASVLAPAEVTDDDGVCPRGLHGMTDENVFERPSGSLGCRRCRSIANKRSKQRRKAG